MHKINNVGQKPLPLFLILSLTALLTFVLAACGSNGGTSPGSGAASTPTPAPTTVRGYGTALECPSDAVVTNAPPAPNVTIKLADAHATITAHVGDVIEIQLPFGLRWTGPSTSVGGLQLQTPAGYASTATKVCIWHFNAQSTGRTQLVFSARAICKTGQSCPQYAVTVTFTIVVK